MWNGNTEVLLAPKAFYLLVYLVSHPGQACSREQLFATLWPNTYVGDHALSVQIADVRRVLGDSPNETQYVGTRSRRGYCFVASVSDAGSPVLAVAPPAPATPSIPETRYASTGEVNIAYQVFGEGRIDLVFVMGWVSHLEYFWREPRFAAFLRRLGPWPP